MTTARSPLSQLKAQADKIAAMLKAFERGETIDVRFAEKIAAARDKESITFAVVMDDKVLKIEMPWRKVRGISEVGIAEWILRHMREARVES